MGSERPLHLMSRQEAVAVRKFDPRAATPGVISATRYGAARGSFNLL